MTLSVSGAAITSLPLRGPGAPFQSVVVQTVPKNMEASEKMARHRSLFEICSKTAVDIVSWLLPFVVLDRAVQCLRTFLMEPIDPRGPWECLWHKVGRNWHGIPVSCLTFLLITGIRSNWK